MSSAEHPVRRGAPRWMKLLLVASLAANLLVVGLVVGHWLNDRERPRGIDRQFGWMIRVVPEDRREMAEAHFEAARPELEAAQADRFEKYRPVQDTMQTEPFDPAALSAAMAETLRARSAQRALVYDRFATLLGEFAPAERVAIADRMESWLAERAEERRD